MARVLMVDDDTSFVSRVTEYLRSVGHEAVFAVDGRQALDYAKKGEFDVVVTDINMPEVDGIGVLLAISGSQEGVPVIVMSGGGRIAKEELLTDATMLGAVEVLAKPFGLQALVEAIERVTS